MGRLAGRRFGVGFFYSSVGHGGATGYLQQQVFLYLAAQKHIPEQISSPSQREHRELARHQRFARFIAGQIPAPLQERAIYLILAHSAFEHRDVLQRIASGRVSAEFLRTVCEISPETARILWEER